MMEKIVKTIDIEKAFRSSSSGIIKSIPGFMIRLIEKFIHQDDMNLSIHKNRELTGVPFVNGILNLWNVKVVVNGGEKVPKTGRFVFVANHPVGGMDALSFLSVIDRFFPKVVSPSNQLFNYIPNLHPVILGVNVFGINTKETADKLNQLFDTEDIQIMIFPAGEVSRRSKGIISDTVWQKTFITKAIQSERDIIPVHISGRNSNMFYFIANFRKALRIKMYIETLLLPKEMMKQKNSTLTFTIGEVIPWQSLTKEKSQKDWAQVVKERVYAIVE
jgi:putative hemolysin